MSAFGAAIEGLQALPVIARDAEWADWYADTAAAVVALLDRRRVALRCAALLRPSGKDRVEPRRAGSGAFEVRDSAGRRSTRSAPSGNGRPT